MKSSLYLTFLMALAFSVAGCATSSDLKKVRAELNQQMEEKFVAQDARITSLKTEQEKNTAALASLRKGHANSNADFAELRDQIHQLRGQVELLKKGDLPKGASSYDRYDELLLKINFIENFLEISKKNSPSDIDMSALPKDSSGKKDKAAMYAAAYQTFKNGHYAKASEAFQDFLATYPSGEYSDNAQFWIGECYFFEKKYEKAILEYEKVTKKFPSSNKVPYALLKQGLSFYNLHDKASAKLLLQQVIKDYPNTRQARIARSKLQEIK